MRKCRYCDREFLANRDWQWFCCRQHRQRWHYLHAREDRINGHTKQMNGDAPREEKLDVVALLALATKPAKPIARRKITI